jgi:hypothetical protein
VQRATVILAAGQDDRHLQALIIAALTDVQPAGAPATFTAEPICQIVALACTPPPTPVAP